MRDPFIHLMSGPYGYGRALWEKQPALAVGETLRAVLAEPDPRLPPEAHSRASVGVAIGGEHPDGHAILTEADMAMYRAKQAGGDAVRVVVDVEGRLRARHPAAGRGLARAIEKLELRLHYQPIIRVRDRTIDGVEALVRPFGWPPPPDPAPSRWRGQQVR